MNVKMYRHIIEYGYSIHHFTDIDDGFLPGDGKCIRRKQYNNHIWWETRIQGNSSWIHIINIENIKLYDSYYNEYITKSRKKKLESL